MHNHCERDKQMNSRTDLRCKIVLAAPLPPPIVELARSLVPAGFDFTAANLQTPDFWAAIEDAQFLVTGFVRGGRGDKFYAAAPQLKLIQLIGSGYDGFDLDAARKAGVLIATNGGANSIAVAEHTLLLMLAVQRRIAWQHNNVVAGKWRVGNHVENKLYELAGNQLGLIGLGAIGREVAKRARAFDMSLFYCARHRLAESDETQLGVEYRRLEDILSSSDVVSIHVPLTPDTRGLIGPSQFALMRDNAILINTSRGGVVQQDALVTALRDHKIAGAGLDVLEREPPDVNDPLLKFNTVILTPHTAGPTWENWHKSFHNSFENVRRVAAGQMPLWIVPELDPSRPVG